VTSPNVRWPRPDDGLQDYAIQRLMHRLLNWPQLAAAPRHHGWGADCGKKNEPCLVRTRPTGIQLGRQRLLTWPTRLKKNVGPGFPILQQFSAEHKASKRSDAWPHTVGGTMGGTKNRMSTFMFLLDYSGHCTDQSSAILRCAAARMSAEARKSVGGLSMQRAASAGKPPCF